MIIDSHCHAWTRWPYESPVPDDESWGRIEQLYYEMQENGVDQALIVCAEINRNPANNHYIAQEVRRRPEVFHQFADVDSHWTNRYHQPGAVDRLKTAIRQFPLKGFTHYLADDDDGAWLYSEEGLAFFRTALENRLIASIHCRHYQQPAIRRLAEAVPDLSILIHHMGHPPVDETPPYLALQNILDSAKLPNIYLKVSGFYYAVSDKKWDYPYPQVQRIVKVHYEHFGPQRLCWGSDYPVAGPLSPIGRPWKSSAAIAILSLRPIRPGSWEKPWLAF